MAEKRGKILVIRGGAIGDFILTVPAIAALQRTFPDTHLEVLGYPMVAELARAAGLIDAFRSIEAGPLARFFARNAALLDPDWSDYFESFNLIISYLYDPDDIFKANVGRTSKAQFIQAQHRPDEKQKLHATEVFLKPLEKLAIFGADPVPSLRLTNRTEPKLPPGDWIAVHPGSGSEKKNWPEENWIQLLDLILERTTANVLLVGGEAEGSRLAQMSRPLEPGRIRVLQSAPLPQLGSVLAQCQAFVGHDSGITHLAAAVGVPVFALWGPSNEEIWKPLNPNVSIIRAGQNLPDLEVDGVAAALRSAVPILKGL